MIIWWLSEEIYLFVFKGFMVIFDKLCDLVIGYIIFHVIKTFSFRWQFRSSIAASLLDRIDCLDKEESTVWFIDVWDVGDEGEIGYDWEFSLALMQLFDDHFSILTFHLKKTLLIFLYPLRHYPIPRPQRLVHLFILSNQLSIIFLLQIDQGIGYTRILH